MRFWPQGLPGRIVAALVLAGGCLALLDGWATRRDAAARAGPIAVDAMEPPVRRPSIDLRAVAGPILLASRLQALAPDVAPVVQILGDGTVAWRRPAPLAQDPAAVAAGTKGQAGIVLPQGGLAGLDPRARSALVDAIARLVRERPVPASRFRAVDVPIAAGELERLLSWVP